MLHAYFLAALVFESAYTFAGTQARDAGLPVGTLYQPGKYNLITDVPGVRVGHTTLVEGEGKLTVGKGPVRTGITVVIPSSNDIWLNKFAAGASILNGNGEASGLMWLSESGVLETPIAITNTLSVPDVQKALAQWMTRKHPKVASLMPVVFECDDSSLNDIQGYHVLPAHVEAAIGRASQQFEEGSVGAGTGMASFDFKSGIGSASRTIPVSGKSYQLGVLVNSNIGTGTRQIFSLGGVAIGKAIQDLMPIEKEWRSKGAGSVVIVVATDAPLLPLQLRRLSSRAFLGISRLGAVGYNGSGEVSLAFSTANIIPESTEKPWISLRALSNSGLNNLFEGVVEATEEAILNSLVAAKSMAGRDGNRIYSFPTDRWKQIKK